VEESEEGQSERCGVVDTVGEDHPCYRHCNNSNGKQLEANSWRSNMDLTVTSLIDPSVRRHTTTRNLVTRVKRKRACLFTGIKVVM